jgi:hypothetical protein
MCAKWDTTWMDLLTAGLATIGPRAPESEGRCEGTRWQWAMVAKEEMSAREVESVPRAQPVLYSAEDEVVVVYYGSLELAS